jgi:IS66 C-terminal element
VNGINPVAYLADVLLRVQTHPASRIDELLPHNWTTPKPERPARWSPVADGTTSVTHSAAATTGGTPRLRRALL